MTFPTATAVLRAYYTATRGGVRAARMDPREGDDHWAADNGRMVEIAAIGKALAGFNDVERALLQWWHDPYFEGEAWDWPRVCAELPALGAFSGERAARSSYGGRGLRGRVEAVLKEEWVVK